VDKDRDKEEPRSAGEHQDVEDGDDAGEDGPAEGDEERLATHAEDVDEEAGHPKQAEDAKQEPGEAMERQRTQVGVAIRPAIREEEADKGAHEICLETYSRVAQIHS